MPFVFENRFVIEDEPQEKKPVGSMSIDPLGGGLSGIVDVPGKFKDITETLGTIALGMAAWPASKVAKYATMIKEGLVKDDAPTLEDLISGKVPPDIERERAILQAGKDAEELVMSIPGMGLKPESLQQKTMEKVSIPFEYLDRGLGWATKPLPEGAREVAKDLLEVGVFAAVPKIAKTTGRAVGKRTRMKKSPEEMAAEPAAKFTKEKFAERFLDEETGKPIKPKEKVIDLVDEVKPKKTAPETIKTAAIKNIETGEIHTGQTHAGIAIEKFGLERDLKLQLDVQMPKLSEGWITDKGRFVTRKEASKIEAKRRVELQKDIADVKIPELKPKVVKPKKAQPKKEPPIEELTKEQIDNMTFEQRAKAVLGDKGTPEQVSTLAKQAEKVVEGAKPKEGVKEFTPAIQYKDGAVKTGEYHAQIWEKHGFKEGDRLGVVTKEGKFLTEDQLKIEGTRVVGVKPTKTAKQLVEEGKALDLELAEKAKPPKGTTLYSGIPTPEFRKIGDLWTKNVGGPIWDNLIMKKIPKMLEKIPGGKAINRAALYDYRGSLPDTPKFVKSLDDMRYHQGLGRDYAVDLGQRLQSAEPASQLKMGEAIRGELDISKLNKTEAKLATEAIDTLYTLGRQAVDVGLLSEKTFFANAGRYMPRLYTSKEYRSLLKRYSFTKPNRLDLSRFKKRQDIPKKIRQEMGEILTPGYPVAKGIAQLTHDIELARFFNGIAKNPEWAIPKAVWKKPDIKIPDGWKKIEGEKLGSLDKSYVHPEIFKDLQESVRIMETPEKVWRKSLGYWKFGKVIVSPKTHARNLMSNSILAHLGGMPMYEQPVYLTKAAKALKSHNKYWKTAKEHRLLETTFTNAELMVLFDRVEGSMSGVKAGSIPEAMGIIGKSWDKTKGAGRGAARLYELEEQWFKVAKMIHNLERKKMKPAAAVKDAEKWLFNYAKVTKFQEKYRSKWYGAPFATFTFKAVPRVTEAAIKTPWRFALPTAIVYAMEQAAMGVIGDTKEQFKAKKKLRPDWQQEKSLFDKINPIPRFGRFPFVDEYGREHYLNLTYILPWGDISEGGEFMGIPGSIRPMSQPFVNELAQQIANYDFFWKSNIVPEKELAGKTKTQKFLTSAKLRSAHLGRTMAPTPVIDILKAKAALQGKPDYKGRERAPGVVAADVFAGIKLYPVDYSEQLVRKIGKIDPERGAIAQKIKTQIKTYSIKRKAMADKGRSTKLYDELIESKLKQLQGMAKEVVKLGEIQKKAGK